MKPANSTQAIATAAITNSILRTGNPENKDWQRNDAEVPLGEKTQVRPEADEHVMQDGHCIVDAARAE